MNDAELPLLSLGQSEFSCLRKSKALYVDKTALIHQFAGEPRKMFLARPRHFGKSVDT